MHIEHQAPSTNSTRIKRDRKREQDKKKFFFTHTYKNTTT